MQTGYMNVRGRVKVDNKEVKGLQELGQRSMESGTTEFARTDGLIVEVSQANSKIPRLEGSIAIMRNSPEYKMFQDWHLKNESKDVTTEMTDAHGVPFGNGSVLYPDCECIKFTEPPINGPAPEKAMCEFILIPKDRVQL